MPLSDVTKRKVAEVIRDHHKALCVEVLGPTAVSAEDLKRLKEKGTLVLPETAIAGREMVSVPAAHVMGVLAATSGDETLTRMSEETFWNYIASAPPQLSQFEKEAIQANRDSFGLKIERMGEDLVSDFVSVCSEERTKLRRSGLVATTVQREVASGLNRKASVASIIEKLKKRFPKLKRNWQMLVAVELQNQLEEGRASAIVASLPRGTDPRVFKRPRPDACAHCNLLYLDGKRPRVFLLSELIANGSNQDRRARRPTFKGPNATEWLPTLGIVHPWCQCALYVLPSGFTFDREGNLIFAKSDDVDELTPELQALLAHACNQ